MYVYGYISLASWRASKDLMIYSSSLDCLVFRMGKYYKELIFFKKMYAYGSKACQIFQLRSSN